MSGINKVLSAIAVALAIALAYCFFAEERDNNKPPSAALDEARANSRMITQLQESVDLLETRVGQVLDEVLRSPLCQDIPAKPNQTYYPVSSVRYIPVVVTAYNPIECQTDSTPYLTASNKPVRPGIVALSRDLEEEIGFVFGDTVVLEGLGSFIFEDRMNKRWKRRVDILMSSREDAKKFGRKHSYLVVHSDAVESLGKDIRLPASHTIHIKTGTDRPAWEYGNPARAQNCGFRGIGVYDSMIPG